MIFRYLGILILGLGLITYSLQEGTVRLGGLFAMTVGLIIVATSLILRPRPKKKEEKPEFTKFEVRKLPGVKLEDREE